MPKAAIWREGIGTIGPQVEPGSYQVQIGTPATLTAGFTVSG
jgi:hypothetical protein